MRTLVKLFGRSPFSPLRSHMDRVRLCVEKLPELFEAVEAGDASEVAARSKVISKLEHEADLTKNDIRAGLKSSLFLPVDRLGLLEILTIQDAIADKAEDIGILLTFREPKMPSVLEGLFLPFLKKNLEAFDQVSGIINEVQQLLESSFGGSEAEKMRAMVDRVAYLEHEVDKMQRDLLKGLFNAEDELPYTAFHLWMHVIGEVGALSNLSEKLANRVLMTMEMK